MANGIITMTKSGSGELYGQIVWHATANGTESNTSTVTAAIQLKRPANWYTLGTWKGTFTVGGTTASVSHYGKVEDEWLTIATITTTVNHSADGSGTCYIYALINGPSATSMEGTSVSGATTVALDKIARYASVVTASNFTDEGSLTLSYSNPAGTAVTSLQACISLDGSTAKTAYKDVPKTGTSYTYPLTNAERNTLRAATPNSNTLTVYVLLKTVIGSSSSVSSACAKMSIVNADPIISPSVVDTNSTITKLTGNSAILVALHSTAKVTINAAAQKYATITSKKVEHGTQTLTADGTLSVSNHPIKFTVVDSRGNTTTENASNTIVPYINPTCAIGNNIPEADGSFALEVTGRFYNGSIGATANTLTVQYRYKEYGGSYGGWTTFGTVTKSGNGYTAKASLTGLDYQTVYTFQARAIDKLNTAGVTSYEKAVIAEPVFDWGQHDFHFNVPVYDQTGALIGNSADEWQNPPMRLGVEYRTTERHEEKPVYAKHISYTPSATIGASGAYTDVDIPHGISGVTKGVRCVGRIGPRMMPFDYSGGGRTWIAEITASAIRLRIYNDTWNSGYTFDFDLYVVK